MENQGVLPPPSSSLPALGMDHIVVPPRVTSAGRNGGGEKSRCRPCSSSGSSYSLGGKQYVALSLSSRTGSAGSARTGGLSARPPNTARPSTGLVSSSTSTSAARPPLSARSAQSATVHRTTAPPTSNPQASSTPAQQHNRPPPPSNDHPLPDQTSTQEAVSGKGSFSRPSTGAPSSHRATPSGGSTGSHAGGGGDDVSWTPQQMGPKSALDQELHGYVKNNAGGGRAAASAGRMGSASSARSLATTATSYDGMKQVSAGPGRKPALLVTMENHLKKEFGLLATSDAQFYGERLKVCREAMVMFMEHFPIYKPILSEIMAEYDRTLVDYSRASSDVNKVKMELDTQKRTHNEALYQVSQDYQTTELRYLADFDKLLGVAQAADAAKEKTTNAAGTLYNEIKRLERQHETDLEKLNLLTHTVRESEKKNRHLHSTITKMQGEIEKAKTMRETIAAKELEMVRLKKDYEETVPKQDFVSLQEEFERKEQYWTMMERKLRRALAARGSKLESLATLTDQLKKERDRLRSKQPTSSTPRPDWDQYELEDLELIAQFQRADVRARDKDVDIGDDLREKYLGEKEAEAEKKEIAKVSERRHSAIPMDPNAPKNAPGAAAEQSAAGGEQSNSIPRTKEDEENDEIIQIVSLSTSERVAVLMEKIKSLQNTISEQNVQLLDATAGGGLGAASGGAGMHTSTTNILPSVPATPGFPSSVRDGLVTRGVTPVQQDTSGVGSANFASNFLNQTTTSISSGGQQQQHQGQGGQYGFLGVAEDQNDPNKILLFGRGKGPSVPSYLRYEGVLEITRQPLSALVSCATAFFQRAAELADTEGMPSSWEAQAWLRNFLVEAHGEVEGIKWGYSILLGIEQYRHTHAVITELSGILEGSLPFRLANDAIAVVKAVQEEALAVANTQQKKRVRKRDLMEVLGALLQYKELKYLEELRNALGKESTIAVDSLLEDTHPFTARLLEQCCHEGMELYSSIVKDLAKEAIIPPPPPLLEGSPTQVGSASFRNSASIRSGGGGGSSAASQAPAVHCGAVRRILKTHEPATAASVVIKLSAPVEEKSLEESQNYTIPLPVILSRMAILPIIMKKRKPPPASNSSTGGNNRPSSGQSSSQSALPPRASTTSITGSSFSPNRQAADRRQFTA